MFKSLAKRNLLTIALAVVLLCVSMCSVAFADTTGQIIGKVLDVIFNIFMWIGIVLLVWSIGMLIMALKEDDGASKSRAIMYLVISVVLIGFKALVGPILDVAAPGVFGTPGTPV